MSPGPVEVTIVPNGVADHVVEQAGRASADLFGRLSPDVVARLDQYRITLQIVPKDTRLTELAPYRHLTGTPSFESTADRPRTWDHIRGAGGMLSGDTITFAVSEEEISRDAILDPAAADQQFYPWFGDRFLLLHEGAHVVYDFGLSPEQQAAVDRMFDDRTADPTAPWLKPNDYTSANSEEYFSNSVAAFFGASHSTTADPDYSRNWLQRHDPKMFAFLTALFPATPPAVTAPAATRAAATGAAPARRPDWDTVELDDIPAELRPQPPPPPPAAPRRRWLVPVGVLLVVALLVSGGIVLAGGGSGGGDGAAGDRAGRTRSASGVPGTRTPGTTVPTDPFATADLPGTLSFTATKTATVVEPPYGIQAVPVGRTFTSSLPITPACDRGTCTFASSFATGTGIVRGTVPQVTWTRDGRSWHVALTAHILSNSTVGAECVYLYTDTWDLDVTQAGRRGAQTVATGFTGSLRREARMDPALSAAGIAAGTCLPYAHADDYAITATGA